MAGFAPWLLTLLAMLAPTSGHQGALWGMGSSEYQCDSQLSPGPEGAAIELKLANLPVSTAERPVHLQWFAGRLAEGFDPTKPSNMTVYFSSRDAYPSYTDPEFNGGNVRVDNMGRATIRLHPPATYFISPALGLFRYPHVHLRLCDGSDYLVKRIETIDFTAQGPVVRACGHFSSTTKYTVESFRMIGSSAPSTTTPPGNSIQVSSTVSPASSTTLFLSATSAPSQAGDDSFDWDSLEFSPIFQCIQENKIYNHFGDGCVDQCPSNAVEKDGQCVRAEMANEAELYMAWRLEVQCDEECWQEKRSRSLHDIRLRIAKHLQITFQEVKHVILRGGSGASASGRALSSMVTAAELYVTVTTKRHEFGPGSDVLQGFLTEETASQMLGLEVRSFQATPTATPPADFQRGEESDEFATFYQEDRYVLPGSPEDVFPAGVIVAVAAGVVVIGVISAGAIYWRKRQQRRQEEANSNEVVKGEKVGAGDNVQKVEM